MPITTNIAGYKFVPLTDLKPLRFRLMDLCRGWNLKGTILLSTEGINLFVAGATAEVDLLLGELRSIRGLEDFQVKFSESDHQPFRRMLVRIKKEIIAFGVEGIAPGQRTSPKLAPATLKQWLDEGRPVTLLDTRNTYEVKLGTFKNAMVLGIDHFREFPTAVRQLPESLKNQPIVMFCTGGIRCEKAGPFMEMEGFQNIHQLDGGILKYFEDCGGSHYQGECFVFDQRVGVDPELKETESAQCYRCQSPLTSEEQSDTRYVPGKSCPYCFLTTEQAAARNLESRQQTLNLAVTPLPGSVPQDNFRPIQVPETCAGGPLIDALCRVVRAMSREDWLQSCQAGRVVDREYKAVAASHIVQAGERYYHKTPDFVEPDVNAAIELLHEDEAFIALVKPAPLPMHPGGRFERNTLQHILNQVYHPQKPHPAHRLDANTTGVVLLTRTRHFASRLQPQFARGEIHNTYLARVQGWPTWDSTTCEASIGSTPSVAGLREVDVESGLTARTDFQVLSRLPDGTAVVKAVPWTGRTNQIRVHLWHLGFPICGDVSYLADGKLGDAQTVAPDDAPLCLHAWRIQFKHPLTNKPMELEAPPPDWAVCFSSQRDEII